jgi:hypothetical protein
LHQPVEGATNCMPCPGGHYQDEEGSLGCKECRPGFYCTAGIPEESICPKGDLLSQLINCFWEVRLLGHFLDLW